MLKPSVSIVLPFYNAKPYLDAAVDSMLAQDYPDFELILIDDGSQDGSTELAAKRCGGDVRLLRQENKGVSAAIAAGIAAAQGQIIVLGSADDVSLPHRLSASVEALRGGDCDIVTCRPSIIDGDGADRPNAHFPFFDRIPESDDALGILASLFFDGNFLCAPAAALTRDALAATGAVHGGLMQMQDFDFWLRAAAEGARFRIAAEPWLKYRWHDSNISGHANRARSDCELPFIYRRLLPHLSGETAWRLLRFSPAAACRDADRRDRLAFAPDAINKAWLYVGHRHPGVRQIGYELLLALLADAEAAGELERRLAMPRAAIFAMVGH